VSEEIADRIDQYILDGSDEDLRRLLKISTLTADMARNGIRRVGVEHGWRAIECGCGPLGALPVLAEMVGPTGQAVGIDFNESTVERARSVLGELGIANAQVLAGDVHDLDLAALGGPFDLAYTRCFLMHQADPARCLRAVADLLRPGGWIVAQEPLRFPAPLSYPPLEALGTYWDLMHEVMEGAGIPHGLVDSLPRFARSVGLEAVAASGSFRLNEPELALDVHGATLAAFRDRALGSGIVTTHEIDALLAALRVDPAKPLEWVSSPLFLDLTFCKPA
jgi:SAM-dependent methyltransferase